MNKEVKMFILTNDELTIKTDTKKSYVVWFDEKGILKMEVEK